jgi:predicted dehydrogenase
VSYLVIGAGSIGKRHHANLQALGAEARLLPWRGIDPGELRTAIDTATGVVIATATDIRLDLIQMAAEAGTPLYIEKPLAFRPADVAAIYELTDAIAERSVLGYMMRYHPAVLAVQADLPALYGFTLQIGHDVRQWRQNWRFADSYAAKPEGGGVLLDLCHELDLAHCFVPDLSVAGVDSIGHADFPGVDFATRISLAGSANGTVAMDYLSPVFERRTTLEGRDERIDLNLLTAEVRRRTAETDETTGYAFDRNDMFLGLMRDFMALAEGRTPSDNPLLPRLDRVRASAELVASAWEKRTFHGMLEGGFE